MSARLDFTVDEGGDGDRLDTALASPALWAGAGMQPITRSRARSLIEQGHVFVDGGAAAKAGQKLRAGQLVTVRLPEPSRPDLAPRDVGLRILHEDEHVAVVEKPAGISVHPSATETAPTLVHGLLHGLKSLSLVGGIERPGIVHRLDKGTSGLLVVSKTDAAHLSLSRQFKAHSVERAYHALVHGRLRTGTGTIETLFGRSPRERKKMTGKVKRGRRAVTHWKRIEDFAAPISLLECRLETGRTHQIRVHLSEMGHPVVADPVYGDHARRTRQLAREFPELARGFLELDHQMLHAYLLGFEHPASGKRIRFESEPPEDFKRALGLARAGS